MPANLIELRGSQLELIDEHARCVAPRWIKTIGVDRMRDDGITPDSLADDELLGAMDLSEEEPLAVLLDSIQWEYVRRAVQSQKRIRLRTAGSAGRGEPTARGPTSWAKCDLSAPR
jgi:hypothetical protein